MADIKSGVSGNVFTNLQSKPAIYFFLQPIKCVHIAGRILIVPLGHFASAAIGFVLVLLGSELRNYNPQGPLRILEFQNILRRNAFSAAGKAMVVLGSIFMYTSFDYFIFGSIANGVDAILAD